jgi:hypothetical protein
VRDFHIYLQINKESLTPVVPGKKNTFFFIHYMFLHTNSPRPYHSVFFFEMVRGGEWRQEAQNLKTRNLHCILLLLLYRKRRRSSWNCVFALLKNNFRLSQKL